MAKQSHMKGELGQSPSLDLQYVINKDINECERHRAIAQFKFRVSKRRNVITCLSYNFRPTLVK